VHFSFEKCTIQDKNSMKMIGFANQVDGLYQLSLDAPLFHSVYTNKACSFSLYFTCVGTCVEIELKD